MVIKLPTEGKWSQPNSSDKFGSIWASKNINLDETGYIKLSPRSIVVIDKDDETNMGYPNALARFTAGEYIVSTAGKTYNLTLTPAGDPDPVENSGSNNPTGAAQSGGVIYNNLWHATTDTTVVSRDLSSSASATWTSRITSLTSGVPHPLATFDSRRTICAANGNVVKQYDSSYNASTDLTISPDFLIVGITYNKSTMAVATRLGNTAGTTGQNVEARLFIWDGETTSASDDPSIGSEACIALSKYKSSFVVLNSAGQLLYYNGGGFDVLASFPFYFEDKYLGGGFLNSPTTGLNMRADGDVIYINFPNTLSPFNQKNEISIPNMPGGVWCFDPEVGLYHRYSPSTSKVYRHSVAQASINTSTDVITVSSGTIPATGNIARVSQFSSGARVVGGVADNYDYYIIKLTSTTFKLATTYENAISGNALDITAADTTTYFYLYEIVDYASTYIDPGDAGVVALLNESDSIKTGIFIGGGTFGTDMVLRQTLCVTTPNLENRGWFITPKVYASNVTDTPQKLFLKFRPLKTNEKILVKYRNKDVVGLPVSTTTTLNATWRGTKSFEVDIDLSEAKTHLDNGGSLECEFTAGAGGGQMVKVLAISTDDDITYSVDVEDDVIGAATDLKASFIMWNWEVKRVITSSDESPVEIPLGGDFSWMQFKIELRGDGVTIEEVQIISVPKKMSQ